MSAHSPMLHLVCGKIASGKSTLTHRLGREPHTIVVSEDHWLSRLYPGEQNSLEDYVRNASRLRERNAGGQHAFTVSEKDFDLISSDFVAPSPDEGFNVIIHHP